MDKWIEDCLILLEMMNSSRSQEFGAAHVTAYSLILSELGEAASRAAVTKAIKSLKWRPSPAELREIAADLASPVPSVSSLWAECWHKAIHVQYTRPEWTHPLIGEIVSQMGGWQAMRETSWHDSHPAHIDAQRRRFEAIYGLLLSEWREAVCEQLSLPPRERDPKYFPKRQQFIAPKSLPPGDRFEPLPSLSELMEDAPEDVKERLLELRKKL